MKTIEAHELLASDRGVEIVVTTLDLTYVGWFQEAKDLGKLEGQRWIGIRLNDSSGLKVSLLLQSTRPVHITPFKPLQVGELVVRAGAYDPDHKNYGQLRLGQVVGTSVTESQRVYSIRWDGQPGTSWQTRRTVEHARPDGVIVDE